MTQPLYTVRQLAYVVRDLDAALKYWTEVLKVGPFFRFDHCPLLEPSVYKEFLDAGRVGVHHFGMMPVDYKATCEEYKARGHAAAFECTVGGAELVYFDTVKTVGHYIELWDNHSVFKDLFMMVEDAAKGWDGKHPVRPGPL